MSSQVYTRRRFLVLVGTVAAGAACVGCAGAAASADGSSQARCPKGQVNDPYPGRCKLYRDTNNSGYCDLSETEG